MEIGALICTSKNPSCLKCPAMEACIAFNKHTATILPQKKKPSPPKNRFFSYFLIDDGDNIFIQKRISNDIWKNLYELPLIETNRQISAEEFLHSDDFISIVGNNEFQILNITDPVTHILSHQKITAWFFHLKCGTNNIPGFQAQKVSKRDLFKYAVPKLIENYLVKSGILL
jgi:A/G-specific adenine glycosylase